MQRITGLTRTIGPLHALVDGAVRNEIRWTKVLHYLESQIVENDSSESSSPTHSIVSHSPLPSNAVPSDKLRKELWYDTQGNSILRKAVLSAAPLPILTALVQLCPEPLNIVDSKQRVPLHHACRLPVNDHSTAVLKVLVQAMPGTLLARDTAGRTPLHYLFWYHGSHRTVEIVTLFLTKLPKTKFYTLVQPSGWPEIPKLGDKVPCTAAIVPDTAHGCLPLHYAVMGGVREPILALLLQHYPISKIKTDRHGRTPLHWYLGAGYLLVDDPEKIIHVSGEAMDPGAEPWCAQPLSVSVVRLVSSSRVARIRDGQDRTPLHWMAHLWAHQYYGHDDPLSLSAVKYLVDLHVGQLISQDDQGRTPLMVLFDATAQLQRSSSETQVQPFALPLECVSLLLEFPGGTHNISLLEDQMGRLPIHVAVGAAAKAPIINALLESHPASLLHTSTDEKSPLHAAFCYSHTAGLQTTESIELLVQRYNLKHVNVDGRLALKMEDSSGYYPLHYACQNDASVDVLQVLVSAYPQSALLQLPDGNLPVHCVVKKSLLDLVLAQQTNHAVVQQARDKIYVLLKPLLVGEQYKLQVACSRFGFFPLHIAVLFAAGPYQLILKLLERFPESAMQFSREFGYSPLDLHELAQHFYTQNRLEWQHIRELLFSFGPTLESHRHREELLSQCVKIIVDEVRGVGSYHLEAEAAAISEDYQLTITHTLSDMEMTAATLKSRGSRQSPPHRPRSTQRRPRGRTTFVESRVSDPIQGVCSGNSRNRKSFYDEDNVELQYHLSDTEYDDDSYFSEEEEADAIEPTDDEPVLYDNSLQTVDDLPDQIAKVSSASMGNSYSFDPTTTHPSQSSEMTKETHSTSMTQVFVDAKRKAELEDEKKEDEVVAQSSGIEATISNTMYSTEPHVDEVDSLLSFAPRPPWFSEVGLRLWSFFAFYRDSNNPNDNYTKQVTGIFELIESECLNRLVGLPLPDCSRLYFPGTRGRDLKRLTYRDAANPKCRELIHRAEFFLGHFDFKVEGDLLVSRDETGATVVVKAYEWLYETEQTTDAAQPGVSEAAIWDSGELPAEVGLTFRASKRPVRLLFTSNPDVYHSEVSSRLAAGIPVEDSFSFVHNTIALVQNYNAINIEAEKNLIYKTHVEDVRFRSLKVIDGDSEYLSNSIRLVDYPYALVLPDIFADSLGVVFSQLGLGIDGVKRVCKDVGASLVQLHANGIVHCNVSVGNVFLSKNLRNREAGRSWFLSGLSCAASVREDRITLGCFTKTGGRRFFSSTLPPEAFVQLSPAYLQDYCAYWQAVATKFGCDTQRLSPFIDPKSGEAYVVKSEFLDSSNPSLQLDLPKLPYNAVELSVRCDLWAFGLILFHLCSGRPLFPMNTRTGELLDYSQICDWTVDKAKSLVYQYVSDHLAQDLLLKLLAPYETWKLVSMQDTLSHPFFSEAPASSTVSTIQGKHKLGAASHARQLQKALKETTESKILSDKIVNVCCWDVTLLQRIYASPFEMLKRMMASHPWSPKPVIPFPCSLVVLPYDLEESGRVTFGLEYIKFSKVLHFATVLEQHVSSISKTEKPKFSASNILQTIGLDVNEFSDVHSSLNVLAIKHIEAFRMDPVAVARRVVRERIESLFAIFENPGVFLYLVDEDKCRPVESAVYPVHVTGLSASKLLPRALLFMHLTSLYARGVDGSLNGLQRLFRLDNIGAIPSQWVEAGRGLTHSMEEAAFVDEIHTLESALSEVDNCRHQITGDDLDFIRDFLYDNDKARTFADMRQVVTSGMSFWTTSDGATSIVKQASRLTLQDLLNQLKST